MAKTTYLSCEENGMAGAERIAAMYRKPGELNMAISLSGAVLFLQVRHMERLRRAIRLSWMITSLQSISTGKPILKEQN